MEYVFDKSTIILQVKSDLVASKVRDLADSTKSLISQKKEHKEVNY
jgi:hypothetical protein